MKTLLIDQDCPLCRTYGHCFVKIGLLDKEGLQSYQMVDEASVSGINLERAKNEIGLYNSENGTATYGLTSIITILTEGNKKSSAILSHPIVFTPLNVLYKFISYNRKVIMPVATQPLQQRACIPSVHIGYRWAYIILVALMTGLIVNSFTRHLFQHLDWGHSKVTELLICFGQVAWQATAVTYFASEKRLTYLGNMSTVSMMGAIIMLPCLIVLAYIPLALPGILLMFFSIVGIMFLEHIRRCQLLGITTWMTFSWLAYRMTALAILIFFMELF